MSPRTIAAPSRGTNFSQDALVVAMPAAVVQGFSAPLRWGTTPWSTPAIGVGGWRSKVDRQVRLLRAKTWRGRVLRRQRRQAKARVSAPGTGRRHVQPETVERDVPRPRWERYRWRRRQTRGTTARGRWRCFTRSGGPGVQLRRDELHPDPTPGGNASGGGGVVVRVLLRRRRCPHRCRLRRMI